MPSTIATESQPERRSSARSVFRHSREIDVQKHDVRARFVACDVEGAAESDPSSFAAAPPLEALIRKAQLNGKARRKIIVRSPIEAGDGLVIIQRSLGGTRDAAACWEACIVEILPMLWFAQGKACPCLFRSDMSCQTSQRSFNGDDFETLCAPQWCRWLRGCLGTILTLCERRHELEADT